MKKLVEKLQYELGETLGLYLHYTFGLHVVL